MSNIVLHLQIISLVTVLACTDNAVKSTDTTQEASLSEQGQWASGYLQEMQDLVASSDEFATVNDLENAVAELEKDILHSWSTSWENGNWSQYDALFVSDAGRLNWNGGNAVENKNFGGIIESSWNVENGTDTAKEYVAQFASVEDLSVKVIHIERQTPTSVIATIEYDFRAIKQDGTRHQDRGHITIVCDKTDVWNIRSMQASTMERMQSDRSPAFVDKTDALGLNRLPITDRKEAIRRGGYALVVSDYDNDGLSDMLVGNYGPINLLRNTGTGFEDVTVAAGLDAEEVIKGAGFVDMDNDGDRDIVMLRFTDSSDPRGDFVIYENNGNGTFRKHTDLLPRRRNYDTPMPLSMGDYNNDGLIDIYIGFPGVRDFTSGISAQERPDWQASQGIWFNQGNWTFVEADDNNAVVADNDTYSHAAASTDLDGDGWIDLLVVDDSGRINPVFRNAGGGTFTKLTEEAGLEYTGMSMGVTTGDFNNDGHLDIMSSHVAMNAGQRMAYSMEGLVSDSSNLGRLMDHIRNVYVDVQLFQNNGDGTFTDVTSTSNLRWAGEAAGAGEWLDYNHDGLLDYYLPNGLWSSGSTNFDSLFFRAELMLYGISILGGEEEPIPFNMNNDIHGGAIFSVSEQGGANPILTLLRNYRESAEAPLALSFAGYQRNALFRNNGDGTFTEVGFLEGVDRVEDGYIIAPVDIDGDGKQDMVLRNTDPAVDQSFAPVIALQNQLPGNTLTVALHSATGNTDGLGARVTVHIGDKIISREIRSVSGAVQGEPVAYFGLGDATAVDKIVVTWPGGQRQEMENVAMGSLRIERN